MLKKVIFLSLFLVVSCLGNLNRFFPKLKLISTNEKIIPHNNVEKLSNVLQHSLEIALENCKEQFKWDRWNCPSTDFLVKRSSSTVTKEAAYVKAISIASVIYTILRNFTPSDTNNSKNLCNDRLKYAEQVAYLQVFQHNWLVEETNYFQLHNAIAGRIAFQKSIQKHCKHSKNTCFNHTCLLERELFPEIAEHLRKMYDGALLLQLDNHDYNDNIKLTSLVYFKESPNYCEKNAIPNWKGTHGRQCSRNKDDSSTIHERKSCKQLCRKCGLRVRVQKDLKNVRCNCRFNGCCVVTCDVCIDYVELFFCE